MKIQLEYSFVFFCPLKIVRELFGRRWRIAGKVLLKVQPLTRLVHFHCSPHFSVPPFFPFSPVFLAYFFSTLSLSFGVSAGLFFLVFEIFSFFHCHSRKLLVLSVFYFYFILSDIFGALYFFFCSVFCSHTPFHFHGSLCPRGVYETCERWFDGDVVPLRSNKNKEGDCPYFQICGSSSPYFVEFLFSSFFSFILARRRQGYDTKFCPGDTSGVYLPAVLRVWEGVI